MQYFIFGAGYSGRRFGQLAVSQGANVFGTSRTPEKLSALEEAGIKPLLFNGVDLTSKITSALAKTTHLIVSAAPDETGDPVVNVLEGTTARWLPELKWIGYLSTVGVYGDHQGGWVDENAECRPVSKRSIQRVAAEQRWIEIGAATNIPVAILRLAGIYGPGRNAFVNLGNGTAKRLVKKDQVFNRIHVDDIAGTAWHLGQRQSGGIFNVTDDLPAPPQDVVSYAADLMGVEPPAEIPFETAQLSPMARSFYGENKRVSNARLKEAGFAIRYPNYQSALKAMWDEGAWPGEGDSDARSPMKS